jgi:hypothetical protein
VVEILEWLHDAPAEVGEEGGVQQGAWRESRGMWKECCRARCGVKQMQALCGDLKKKR